MNTCKTSNPNYVDSSDALDYESVEMYFYSMAMNGFSDDTIYDCEEEDCDHEFCLLIDMFNITRQDILLFPELESASKFYVWDSEYSGVGSNYDDSNCVMPVYALGL